MRAAVTAFALIAVVATAAPSFAEPITDPSSVIYDQSDAVSTVAGSFALHQLSGAMVLITSNPIYFRLPAHSKIRDGGTAWLDNFVADFYRYGSQSPAPGFGTPGGGDPQGGNPPDGNNPGDTTVIPEGPGDGGTGGGGDNGPVPSRSVPEPASLLLLGPAAALALRRRARG